MPLVQWITDIPKLPQSIWDDSQHIKMVIQNFEVTNIQYTQKEGNHAADRFANYGVECKCTEWLYAVILLAVIWKN